ncbi:hypothetical protein MTQ10_22665 [Streptomyces sp. XM83C]|jgi:hypothetical protein|uniref:Uncharacterized protein n=1 Tax=Streptomyces thermocoprophilus TaxID=78356 RepID=A0ABV5VJ03_9ACTN|nr:hypothetical protein [Streptomyces sp. XM83C]MCK1822334.1 hypothetical protein [Streptomyces sp. XM83C]
MGAHVMKLKGFRAADAALLTGDWLPGELLGLPVVDRPPLAEPSRVPPPRDDRDELCVVPGTGFVRFTGVDWIHRHARLEIGLRSAAEDPRPVLEAALRHGFRVLGMRRLYGWLTPGVYDGTETVLKACGLQWEATVPQALWVAGGAMDRQLWGALHASDD